MGESVKQIGMNQTVGKDINRSVVVYFLCYFGIVTRKRPISSNLIFLTLGSFFADISTEMLYPVLPIFLTQVLKTNGSIVGLIEGIAGATQNIVQGLSGWLADRLQRKKPIAVLGYALAAASKPVIGLAQIWPVAMGARFMDRFGTGVRSAPRDGLVASSVDSRHRGKAFGLEGAGDNLGAFVGPILTILLLYLFRLNIRAIFYLAFIPGLLAMLMVWLVREKPLKTAAKAKLDTSLHRFPLIYWKYLGAVAIFGFGSFSNSFLILQTRDLGVSLVYTIGIYALFNLVAALVSYPSGTLSDTWGRKRILLFSFLISIITYAGFALFRNILIIAFLFILYGVYQGAFRSVGKALAADLVPEAVRASGIGWYSTTVGLSGLVASIMAGQLWDKWGHQAVFVYGLGFAILGGLALVLLVRQGGFEPPTLSSED